MFGLFRSDPYMDPELGTFIRSRGKWRGRITLPGVGERPLVLTGNRKQPDAACLHLARQLPSLYEGLIPDIQNRLFEHYEPYLQAREDGEYRAGERFPQVNNGPALWDRVRLLGVSIGTEGRETTEIAYETDWDEEHVVGARIKDGRLVELNGSTLADF